MKLPESVLETDLLNVILLEVHLDLNEFSSSAMDSKCTKPRKCGFWFHAVTMISATQHRLLPDKQIKVTNYDYCR